MTIRHGCWKAGRKAGRLKRLKLKAGRLEGWTAEKAGRLDGWKAGRLEGWKAGRLDGWKTGRLKRLEGWKGERVKGKTERRAQKYVPNTNHPPPLIFTKKAQS